MHKSIKIYPKKFVISTEKHLKKTLVKHLQWSTLFSNVNCPYLQVYKKQSFIEDFSHEFCKNAQLIVIHQNTCRPLLLLPYGTKTFQKFYLNVIIIGQFLPRSLSLTTTLQICYWKTATVFSLHSAKICPVLTDFKFRLMERNYFYRFWSWGGNMLYNLLTFCCALYVIFFLLSGNFCSCIVDIRFWEKYSYLYRIRARICPIFDQKKV